jgi:hypothetical protein
MKCFLIFLIFISFVSNIKINEPKSDQTCKGGTKRLGKCYCPNGYHLSGNECIKKLGSSTKLIKHNDPCPEGYVLKNGKCERKPKKIIDPCPEGYVLKNGKCELKPKKIIDPCPEGYVLKNGKCELKPKPNNDPCPIGYVLKNGKCVRKFFIKETNDPCPSGYHLQDGKCKPYLKKPGVILKPVIYLYPEKPMDISVQLNLKNSNFSTIYPKFNEKNTWNVHAKPNGDIILNDRTYPYLFWEADSYDLKDSNEGFIVTEENAEKFLEEKLEILGLNEKERADFIVFWLPHLIKNKLSLCTFQSKKFFDDFELNITPKPDTVIRIYLSIKKLDSPINVKEQKLESVERKGYTVIEWGGFKL